MEVAAVAATSHGIREPEEHLMGWSQLIAALLMSIFCVPAAWPQTPASKPSIGPIVGNMDGISQDGSSFSLPAGPANKDE
jgi:hypothetical protein